MARLYWSNLYLRFLLWKSTSWCMHICMCVFTYIHAHSIFKKAIQSGSPPFRHVEGVVLILQAWFLSYRFLGPSNSREHPICAGDSCVLFCPGRWNRSLGPRSHHRLQATFQHVLESHPRKLGNAWKCKEFKRNITFQNARFPCGSVFFFVSRFFRTQNPNCSYVSVFDGFRC